jgi:type I restriction enzyme M protein
MPSKKEEGETYDFQTFAYAKKSDEVFETNKELFERINQLYRRALKQRLNIVDNERLEKILVDDGVLETALDYLKQINWS